MKHLLNELKVKIVQTLNLEGVIPDEIDEDDQLVGGELGIDSIDVLELVMMIEKDYLIKIDNKEFGTEVFSTLKALAEYVYENSPEIPH
jgi:acyl carrier protein